MRVGARELQGLRRVLVELNRIYENRGCLLLCPLRYIYIYIHI